MQPIALSLSLLASAVVGALAAVLKIDVTLPVECDRRTQKGDKIQVHYRGTLQSNGQKFDASYDRGSPFSFSLGRGQVIKGTLTVPPEFGYGQRGMGPIPAGSTLVFETELVAIAGVPTPETIVTKRTTDDLSSTSSVSADQTPNIVDKMASKVAEAAEVVKTIVVDTDDGQEHNEL
ncbi:fkbp-type peptidyl-prolyl cis-trans isomerase [Grosmannia clavigera kw1407]|uniref:peptidylprolyl isomerase n=1 Tax=Grosmannia clavigera (strain kw1407 / UAMH 11150) TaxID=655863 RepID=F0XJX8_GROCL|nr:fkbp-type peptidyl-prolyl cis-trans isomerase [Grosmannia clavigera kw1407]EFX01848.1 fkbp-type peptidyl-prolyl cis-trans isomerase [Grosmannia clavigera kw1407]